MKSQLRFTTILYFFILIGLLSFGQTNRTNPIREGSFVILDSANIEFLASRDSLTPADLGIHDRNELNSFIVEFIDNMNRIVEPEVDREIKKNPQHSELIKDSKYLHKPDTYFYQLLPTKNDRGHKLVWVNGIHSSWLDKHKDIKSLILIADGRNKYFNFWVDFETKEILK